MADGCEPSGEKSEATPIPVYDESPNRFSSAVWGMFYGKMLKILILQDQLFALAKLSIQTKESAE